VHDAIDASTNSRASVSGARNIVQRFLRIIGVATVAVASGDPSLAKELTPDDILPTHVICPKGSNRSLTLISENILGDQEKIVAIYRGDQPIKISIAAAAKETDFAEFFTADLTHQIDDSVLYNARQLIKAIEPIRARCAGGREAVRDLRQELENNRARLLAGGRKGNQ
jgi:hypothetical protein